MCAVGDRGMQVCGYGCVDCKQPLIDAINSEQEIIRQRAVQFEEDSDLVHAVIAEGSERARAVAGRPWKK